MFTTKINQMFQVVLEAHGSSLIMLFIIMLNVFYGAVTQPVELKAEPHLNVDNSSLPGGPLQFVNRAKRVNQVTKFLSLNEINVCYKCL